MPSCGRVKTFSWLRFWLAIFSQFTDTLTCIKVFVPLFCLYLLLIYMNLNLNENEPLIKRWRKMTVNVNRYSTASFDDNYTLQKVSSRLNQFEAKCTHKTPVCATPIGPRAQLQRFTNEIILQFITAQLFKKSFECNVLSHRFLAA